MDFAIVDLQGFKNNFNHFIVKEIAVLTKNIKFHDVIKSSCEFNELNASAKKSVEWLIKFHHRIAWDDGYITADELQKTLAPVLKNKIVYVKGKEKKAWLLHIMSPMENLLIKDMEELGCNLNLSNRNQIPEESTMTCARHKKMLEAHVCALRNAVKLKLWYSEFCKRNKK